VSTTPDPPRRRATPRPPAARPATDWHRPADISRELLTLLRTHGLTHLYWSACGILAVISIAPGVTAWCDGRYLTCHYQGTRATWPAASTEQAARELAQLAQQPGSGRS
jgi:hypothetical protein